MRAANAALSIGAYLTLGATLLTIPEWTEDAACIGQWELMDDGGEEAEKLCRLCPVRDGCLDDMMRHEAAKGWRLRATFAGGLSHAGRARYEQELDYCTVCDRENPAKGVHQECAEAKEAERYAATQEQNNIARNHVRELSCIQCGGPASRGVLFCMGCRRAAHEAAA